jgi:hypothetical protein
MRVARRGERAERRPPGAPTNEETMMKPLPEHVPGHVVSHIAGNHCVHPNGTDLNALYGISEQIVTRFCPEVLAGEHWTAPGPPWQMNTSFESMPDGFVPAGATPLDDFRAKFVGAVHEIVPLLRDCVPESLQQTEMPVLCLIRPDHVVAMDFRPEPEPSRLTHGGCRPVSCYD